MISVNIACLLILLLFIAGIVHKEMFLWCCFPSFLFLLGGTQGNTIELLFQERDSVFITDKI